MASIPQIPATPRVISPSPTPSEKTGRDGYFPPSTRSKTVSNRNSSVEPIDELPDTKSQEEDPELQRARSRSRTPQLERKPTWQVNGNGHSTATRAGNGHPVTSRPIVRKKPAEIATPQADGPNDFLSPASAYPKGFGSAYWRNLSRSPSPLGLIPIHRDWRKFVHKHEIPRKLLHVSIGFVTLYFYHLGAQASIIHPMLLSLLIPITTADVIRFRWPAFNKVYIKYLGAFMRESEAHDRYNGVIAYIAGLWFVMRFCRKDVAVMGVLLLSWCDTAASTFGRLWGKYTPRVRRGKSLAGTIACFTFGVAAALLFWGAIAPRTDSTLNQGVNRFAYEGYLTLPTPAREALGWTREQATVSGTPALWTLSISSGLIASIGEAIDIFGLDDNLTIPVLCGTGLGIFLWAFGAAA